MSNLIKKHRLYAAWEYEKEESDLNSYSQNGWQLVHGGCFSSTFEKDASVRYVYQLDYNPKVKDIERYKEVFEEQGWTYINSTFNGWHYFRKLYREGAGEDEYKIYTDPQSLREMQNRWVNLVNILSIFYLLGLALFTFAWFSERNPIFLVDIFTFIFGIFVFQKGARTLKNKGEGKVSRMNLSMNAIIFVLIASLVVIFASVRWNNGYTYITNFSGSANEESESIFNTLNVSREKNYRLNADIDITRGTVGLIIMDPEGNIIYNEEGMDYTISNAKIHLKKGQYTIGYIFNVTGEDYADMNVKMTLK